MNDVIDQFLGDEAKRAHQAHDDTAQPCPFIDFVMPQRSQAFAYSHLYSVAFDGSIELTFTEHRVVLAGENLSGLYMAIQQQAVGRVAIADELHAKAANLRVYVTSIEVRAVESHTT